MGKYRDIVMLPSLKANTGWCVDQCDKLQHFYITADKPLKKGDYIIWLGKFLERVTKVRGGFFVTTHGVRNPELRTSRKVILSTDTSLKLPRPAINIIKNYCEKSIK